MLYFLITLAGVVSMVFSLENLTHSADSYFRFATEELDRDYIYECGFFIFEERDFVQFDFNFFFYLVLFLLIELEIFFVFFWVMSGFCFNIYGYFLMGICVLIASMGNVYVAIAGGTGLI